MPSLVGLIIGIHLKRHMEAEGEFVEILNIMSKDWKACLVIKADKALLLLLLLLLVVVVVLQAPKF